MPPGDEGLEDCFLLLDHMLTRALSPRRRIAIETINDQPAVESPYASDLRGRFESDSDLKTLTLYRSRSGGR